MLPFLGLANKSSGFSAYSLKARDILWDISPKSFFIWFLGRNRNSVFSFRGLSVHQLEWGELCTSLAYCSGCKKGIIQVMVPSIIGAHYFGKDSLDCSVCSLSLAISLGVVSSSLDVPYIVGSFEFCYKFIQELGSSVARNFSGYSMLTNDSAM